MSLAEYSALNNNLPNNTATYRPSAIDFSAIENGHQILSNSVSNSSTNSNTSAFSISSNLSENACPTLPKSFVDNNNGKASFNEINGHQCLKPGLIKHPLLYQHTAAAASNQTQSNHSSPHAHSPHSPLSPLAHFSHLHHHLHLQQNNGNRTLTNRATDLTNSNNQSNQLAHHGQLKPLCRTQNINNFSKLADALHRKIEYTGSSSSTSTSTSGCVSASSSSHHFQLSNSSACGSSSGPSSGPQTPSSYVPSPLAQSFTTDSGLCLSYRSNNSILQQQSNNTSNATISNLNSNNDLTNDILLSSGACGGVKCEKVDKIDNSKNDGKYESIYGGSLSGGGQSNHPTTATSSNDANDLKLINRNTIKKMDLNPSLAKTASSNSIRVNEQKASFLNLPSSRKKDTDDESLLSDYSKDLSSTTGGNLSSISATSTTNLVSVGNSLHSAISTKPSLPGASSSFFHYPNIYNPLKNSRNNTKNNKKLIRFFTVCAYVLCVSLVAILLSLYYLFIWNPYTKTNAEEPLSIERYGIASMNGALNAGSGGSLVGSTINSLGNSEESDATNNGGNSGGGGSGGGSIVGQTFETRSLPIALTLKRSIDQSSMSSSLHNSMIDSEQTDYSVENTNY